jgi:hypothetical protein
MAPLYEETVSAPLYEETDKFFGFLIFASKT